MLTVTSPRTEVQRSRLVMGKQLEFARVAVNQHPVIPPPESQNWWWHPGRIGVKLAPEWFQEKLREFDPDIQVAWNQYTERWQVWMRSEKFRSGNICWGWKLLFVVQYPDGSYKPLDNRIFWRLADASERKWGSGKNYWASIEGNYWRRRERAERQRQEDVRYAAKEYWDYMSIKNIGKGSKFATHFA